MKQFRFPITSPALLFLTIFLFSCGNLEKPDFRGIENLKVTRLGLKESTLGFDLRCYNPNKSRLKLKRAAGKAWIDGNYLGEFRIDSSLTIPAKGDFQLPVRLQVDMKETFKNPLKTLFADGVVLKIDGNARVGKSGIFINYPFRYEGKQDWGKLLSN